MAESPNTKKYDDIMTKFQYWGKEGVQSDGNTISLFFESLPLTSLLLLFLRKKYFLFITTLCCEI